MHLFLLSVIYVNVEDSCHMVTFLIGRMNPIRVAMSYRPIHDNIIYGQTVIFWCMMSCALPIRPVPFTEKNSASQNESKQREWSGCKSTRMLVKDARRCKCMVWDGKQ